MLELGFPLGDRTCTSVQLVPRSTLAFEGLLQLGAHLFQLGPVLSTATSTTPGRDLLERVARGSADRDGDDDLGLYVAVLLALELRPQAGAEALLGLGRRHPSTFMMFIRAGPRMTMNIAGKMKMTVGNSILIGAFIAFSSAAAWRRRRESAAWTRRMRPSEMPS